MKSRRRRSHGHHHGGQGRDRYKRGHHGREHGGKRRRARRGEARYILLDVLRDGPKHGYEIIKTLEERSAGEYVPSPGTVYPTLQYLEEQGLLHAQQESERRVYQLTNAGEAELEAQAESIAAFWSRFSTQEARTIDSPEVTFLEDELEHLSRIVWNGLRDAIAQGNQEQIRRVRQVVEACQAQVREVITNK